MRPTYRLVLCALCFLICLKPEAQNLALGLQARYEFENNLLDETLNNHDLGIETGSVSYLTFSASDTAVDFDGNSSLSLLGTFDNSGYSSMAVALWFKVGTITNGFQVILQGAFMGFGVFVQATSGNVSAFFDGTSIGSIQTTSALADDTWHHIVAQTDGTTTSIFIDGVFDGSINEPFITGNGGANNKFYLGKSNLNASSLTGSVNDVRVYDRTLSPCEITSLALGSATAYSDSISVNSCAPYTSPSGTAIWDSSGVFVDTLFGVAPGGCDSVITVDLSIGDTTYSSISVQACESYTSPSGNHMWTASGVYSDTLINIAGCDSIIAIQLDVFDSSDTTIIVQACGSYTSPSGNYTWTASGTYLDTLTNNAGCNSIITVELSIGDTTYSSISAQVCESYTSPSGNHVWTTSGVYSDTLINIAGCDSIITIQLDVFETSDSTVVVQACDSYTSPSGNYTWTTSGTYLDTLANNAGCDSIITIQLSLGDTTYSSISVQACESYASPSGNHVWTASGVYSDTLINSTGCDSIIAIQLGVFDSSDTTIAVQACNSYTSPSGNYTWTISGTYADTLLAENGCDSVLLIELIILDGQDPVCDTGCTVAFPNVITPNGDGVNDLFVATDLCGNTISFLEIYNRWGQLIVSSNGGVASWDGSIEGTRAKDGIYYYVVNINGEDLRGSFTMIAD